MTTCIDAQELLETLRHIRYSLAHTLSSANAVLECSLSTRPQPNTGRVDTPQAPAGYPTDKVIELESIWNQLQQKLRPLTALEDAALEKEVASLRVQIERDVVHNTELLHRCDMAIQALEQQGQAGVNRAWTILDDSVPLSILA